MKKNILLVGLFLLLISHSYAQEDDSDIKIVEGSYQLLTKNMDISPQDACFKCVELAKLDAIEKAFGRVLVQGNVTYVKNIQKGDSVETEQVFNMISESLANGEWLKTIDYNCYRPEKEAKLFNKKKYLDDWVDCKVKGKVRKLDRPRWELDIKTMNCPEVLDCETSDFMEEDFFYISLTSPINGYITIYLWEGAKLQLLLPYYRVPAKYNMGLPVEAQEQYTFFAKNKDKHDLLDYVHSLQMYANTSRDINRLYVIYSPEPLVPPILSKGASNANYKLPREISVEDFNYWLAKQRTINKDVVYFTKDIVITKGK